MTTPSQNAGPAKLLVAVHGIGDQVGYATAQTVAARVAAYYGKSIAMPLGRFYPPHAKGAQVVPKPALVRPSPTDKAAIGLAEVYWAPIARGVVEKKYILEETKKWARSISARVASRGVEHGWTSNDVARLVTVLDQMVDSILVMERLTFLANKAGVFKFELAKLLADFVGDVQIVADFEGYRQEILETFDAAMKDVLAVAPDPDAAELYIVAHSEGTVITFVALLHALADPATYPWIGRVRGLMTIGSPIEVHHLLWPELWRDRPATGGPRLAPATAVLNSMFAPAAKGAADFTIPWHNYLDFGDPIAYELEATKAWMSDPQADFARHLPLEEHPFGRSFLPGKAHVDYWNDADVFGHFFEKVVDPPAAKDARFKEPPASKPLARAVASVVPTVVVVVLLILAVYCLYRPVASITNPTARALDILRDVAGLGALLYGITAASRIPRLMDRMVSSLTGALLLAVSMAAYGFAVTPETQVAVGETVCGWINSATCDAGGLLGGASIAMYLVATLIAVVSGVAARLKPTSGHLALPAIGAAAALMIVYQLIITSGPTDVAFWPIALGAGAFFYLWWLGALLFDLIFVWQRYVRNSALREHLERMA
jgi:hypothetical protein